MQLRDVRIVKHLKEIEGSQDYQGVLDGRQKTVDLYQELWDTHDIVNAELIADSLQDPDKPLSKTIAIIPVAAHQEAPNIENTIDQYARQETTQSFTVVLGLNTPTDKQNDPETLKTIDEVEKSKLKHPHLDIRTSFITYDKPVIGEIRRDLWNAVLLVAKREDAFNTPGDVIGTNMDIDTEWMASSYISRVQTHFRRDETRLEPEMLNLPITTRTRHGHSTSHPNTSKVISWLEYTYPKIGISWEAGHAIPLSFYADKGGFDKHKTKHEMSSFDISFFGARHLPGTTAILSPRRFLSNLDKSGYDLWRGNTFGAYDECREDKEFPDITTSRSINIINSSMRNLFLRSLERTAKLSYDLAKIKKDLTDDELRTHMLNHSRPKAAKLSKELTSFLSKLTVDETVQATARAVFNDKNVTYAVTSEILRRSKAANSENVKA